VREDCDGARKGGGEERRGRGKDQMRRRARGRRKEGGDKELAVSGGMEWRLVGEQEGVKNICV